MTEPAEDLLDAVRGGCCRVASVSSFVTIDLDRIDGYATALLGRGAEVPPDAPTGSAIDPWAAPGGGADDERRVALVIALDAINFGSGYHPHVAKLPGLSGARTMATRLRTWAEDEGGIRAASLVELGAGDAHRIFGQPETDETVELMGLFTAALNEIGRVVIERHQGSFLALVGSAEGFAARLVEDLAAIPSYADRSSYRGIDVPFFKRAQITAADLHRAFGGVGPGAFTDIDRLTAFADNLVPHVLRVDGVLTLDPDLEATIDRGDLLVHGDEPEVELRACGLHAVELLRDAATAAGVATNSAGIDQLLWERGAGRRYKAVPRSRARTTAY